MDRVSILYNWKAESNKYALEVVHGDQTNQKRKKKSLHQNETGIYKGESITAEPWRESKVGGEIVYRRRRAN